MTTWNYLKDYLTNIDWVTLLLSIGLVALRILIVLIIYIVIKKISKAFVSRLFETYTQKNAISKGRAFTLESLTNNLISYLLFFILIITILQLFGINATAILAGAGIIGLAVGFGAQGLVSDIVTGFFLLLERQLDVGDLVTIAAFSGTVEQVGLRTTQVRSADGTLHFIPNREITLLSNHSRGDMQALVDIVVSNNNDIPKTIEILQKACDSIAMDNPAITDGPNVIGIQNLGVASTTIRILAKTVNGEQWGIERLIKEKAGISLEENGIKKPETPFIIGNDKG
ncbi:mechanosensitive ion channel family protein [Bacillus sp. B1-b2]|uniref:mechanosensitive ion channel family protein n=1 Tax=Bacillus sp. B1-b2 TaxID=2653201 RepID=UPI0012624807|nr:mechanosensitive ion channel family protein [Bacillus sp. B1-b2]KAB7669317.1 mechanosensitive ion channel family protein [Bacillus sp. B1-b2]